MFGYDQKTLPVRYAGGPLLQAGPPAGFEQFAGTSPDRPQVIARFTGGEAGVLSGLMRNPDQIRNRPMIVDAPSGKGRVILFANNPIYRWQTFGEHAMVFNALAVLERHAGAARDGEARRRPRISNSDRSRSEISSESSSRNSRISAAFRSLALNHMSASGPTTGMAPRMTSTSTFDSIFDTSDGGGPNCSVRAISVNDTAAPAKLPTPAPVEHGIEADPAEDRQRDRAVHDPREPIDVDAEDRSAPPRCRCRAPARSAPAGEGVGGDAAHAAIDDRRHLLGGAHEHPAQREEADARATTSDDDERDGQPEQQRFEHLARLSLHVMS